MGKLGEELVSISNHAGTAALIGRPAVSVGQLSAFVTLPKNLPMVPGRRGQPVSRYRGTVWEVSNASHMGASGGPIIDSSSYVVALATLAQAPERRVGSAIPLHVIDDDKVIRRRQARKRYELQQQLDDTGFLNGPPVSGNPRTLPRPAMVRDDLPAYQQQQKSVPGNAIYISNRYCGVTNQYRSSPSVRTMSQPLLNTCMATPSKAFLHHGGDIKRCILEEVQQGIAIFRSTQPHLLTPVTNWQSEFQRVKRFDYSHRVVTSMDLLCRAVSPAAIGDFGKKPGCKSMRG